MDPTLAYDPATIAILAVVVPIGAKWLSGRLNSHDRRLDAIETFLSERFGDPKEHFRPGNGGR